MVERWKACAPWLLSALRIVAAFIFMLHGTQKLLGAPLPLRAPLTPFTQVWFAGVLETFGGAMLAAGLFTRPVAFLLSGQMAVAYFQSHAPRAFWPTVNGGEAAALYCFLWLYISAAGPGPLALDRWIRWSRPGRGVSRS